MTARAYGWNPSRPDHRDHEFLPTVARHQIPAEVALDISGIPVIDQGQQGSCTGHGTAGVVMFDQKKQGEPIVIPSREFIYWNARNLEGTADQDSGAQVRDAVKVVATLGVPPDSDFPYNDQVYNVQPPQKAYDDAIKQEALVYEAVAYPHLDQALASGFPLVFGFTVYESFESPEVARTGIVPIPERGERALGGHCVWMWGYNARHFGQSGRIPPRHKGCRNSWVEPGGAPWGDQGDFYLPQWFFDTGQASDFWAIRRIGAR